MARSWHGSHVFLTGAVHGMKTRPLAQRTSAVRQKPLFCFRFFCLANLGGGEYPGITWAPSNGFSLMKVQNSKLKLIKQRNFYRNSIWRRMRLKEINPKKNRRQQNGSNTSAKQHYVCYKLLHSNNFSTFGSCRHNFFERLYNRFVFLSDLKKKSRHFVVESARVHTHRCIQFIII